MHDRGLRHVACLALGLLTATSAAAAEPVDFRRDIYPLLQRACFECHGPQKQEAELRFDQRDKALRHTGVITPGKASASELIRRISLPAGDPEVMPSRGATLKPDEIAKIKAWIDNGADWPENVQPERHWAYQSPIRAPLLTTIAADEHPIDAWVRDRLHREGLAFSPPADKTTLIRRVTLDLIGLPPTPAEVEAFEQDNSEQAYETLVDRLLASPQYGVRWARPWLDYARYADSHGFQRDDFRDLWPYRDWVVNSLNTDMPFDQFTIEQLAGDLLPDATESQRIATGFNRSAPTNVEAGSDPEETRVNQVLDRVNTLGMVWLGTTLECAQCHDHKYDPFTQKDYYGLFAFFNNTSLEADRTNAKIPGSIQFQGPSMELADPTIEAERGRIRALLAEVKTSHAAIVKEVEASLAEWEATIQQKRAQAAAEHVLEISAFESTGGATHEVLPDHSVLISGEPAPDKDTYHLTARTRLVGIRAIKLETLTDDSLPGKGPGRGDEKRPNFVLNNVVVTAESAKEPRKTVPVKFHAARASFSQANHPVTNLLKANNPAKTGWAINPKFHEPHSAILETADAVGFDEGTILTFKLEQNFGGSRTIGRLRLSVITGDLTQTTLPAAVTQVLGIPVEKRTEKQRQLLLTTYLKENPRYNTLEQKRTQLEKQLASLKPPSTLVMREDTPRRSTLFQRGDFRSPGDRVVPVTPAALHPLNSVATSPPTRLDLARWLVSRDNPLVARVVVNRWWGELFGHALVTTPEDFGIKGERPTHPELLDWLACEFMDRGWSQKALLKTIVMSETYRQSSRITPELHQRDDQNRWHARGPRHRLDAEVIRDNALAISGLLNLRLGGPPIKPYQPDGLWIKVGGQRYDYEVSPGAEQHRRGLYVIWKRSAPYPSFVNFDANNRLACRVQRPRSNTPLQALTLMNDLVYVEAATAFARRVLTELPNSDDSTRIQYAFRLAVSRSARPEEIRVLQELLDAERTARTNRSKSVDAELAAWIAVTTTLLNLDETITKG